MGTAVLLDMLTREEPDVDFTLALGADTFIDLASGRWSRTEDVFESVGRRIVVFGRLEGDGGDEGAAAAREGLLRESIAKWTPTNDSARPIRTIRIPTLSDVSSSAARRTSDLRVLRSMLSSDVLEYVRQNRMYSLGEGDVEGRAP